jgi:glycosyltransferase involved in cell wall biosynthesis
VAACTARCPLLAKKRHGVLLANPRLFRHVRLSQGGEDTCFSAEAKLLQDNGHNVTCHTKDNKNAGDFNYLSLSANAIWNDSSYSEIKDIVRDNKIEVVHFHNTLPLISPAAYYAARSEGAAVVQTLHNYRLICPPGIMMRNNRVCADCVGKSVAWPAVLHACYRNDRVASAVLTTMLATHKALGTWHRKVDAFIAITEFARQRLIDGGVSERLITVKPNFVDPDPGVSAQSDGYALFLGRLAPEKGIETMLAAWERLSPGMTLKVVGDGPLRDTVMAAAARNPAIEFVGRVERKQVFALLGKCAFLVFPSEWYETFGLVAIEAYAKGKPVIASRLGAMAGIGEDHHTGLQFEPGDVQDLAEKIQWAAGHASEMLAYGRNARNAYWEKFSAKKNYTELMAIYETARQRLSTSAG